MYRLATGIFILLFALLGLTGHTAWLFSQGYTAYTREALSHHRSDSASLAASRLAAVFSPFSHRELARYSLVLAQNSRHEEADTALQLAFLRAPSDPYLWQTLVRYKTTYGQFDADYAAALKKVHTLAPSELSLHKENTVIGLRNWYLANADIQGLWMVDVKKVIRLDRKWLKRWVIRSRHSEVFCKGLDHSDQSILRWCAAALNARQACFTGPRTRRVQRWCRRQGLLQDSLQ